MVKVLVRLIYSRYQKNLLGQKTHLRYKIFLYLGHVEKEELSTKQEEIEKLNNELNDQKEMLQALEAVNHELKLNQESQSEFFVNFFIRQGICTI